MYIPEEKMKTNDINYPKCLFLFIFVSFSFLLSFLPHFFLPLLPSFFFLLPFFFLFFPFSLSTVLL